MSLSKEYQDEHLTPKGWVEGTESLDFGGTIVAVPDNCVMTVRHYDETPHVGTHIRWSKVTFRSGDEALVERLLKAHGDGPLRRTERELRNTYKLY
jgi:hypothetical protein